MPSRDPVKRAAEKAADLVNAAELLESIVVAADGGHFVHVGHWEAITILLMLESSRYTGRVRAAHFTQHGPMKLSPQATRAIEYRDEDDDVGTVAPASDYEE